MHAAFEIRLYVPHAQSHKNILNEYSDTPFSKILTKGLLKLIEDKATQHDVNERFESNSKMNYNQASNNNCIFICVLFCFENGN